MKAQIRISAIAIEAEVQCDDPQLQSACQKALEQSQERIEAAMAHAARLELERILPGVKARITGILGE